MLYINHHNIRSIRNKINDIVHIVQDFDIVFFTETHLDDYIDSENIVLPWFEILFGRIEIPREVVLLYILKIISDFLDVMTENQQMLNQCGLSSLLSNFLYLLTLLIDKNACAIQIFRLFLTIG